MDHEAFYAAVLTASPLILLTISRGVVFGPLPAASRHRAWRLQRWTLLNDLAAVVLISMAAVYSLLALSGVIGATVAGRNLVVSAGLLTLLLVLLHVAGDIVSAHLADRDTDGPGRRDVGSSEP